MKQQLTVILLSLLLIDCTLNVNGESLHTETEIDLEIESKVNGPIARSEILRRAAVWVNAHVPYSQSKYRAFDLKSGKQYRTDCSGFVSLSWNLDTSYTTSSLEKGAPCTRISDLSTLKPGDIFLHPGHHTMLFNGWTDAARSHFNSMEEHSTAVGCVAMKRKTPSTSSGYFACRYNKVTEDGGGGGGLSLPLSQIPSSSLSSVGGEGEKGEADTFDNAASAKRVSGQAAGGIVDSVKSGRRSAKSSISTAKNQLWHGSDYGPLDFPCEKNLDPALIPIPTTLTPPPPPISKKPSSLTSPISTLASLLKLPSFSLTKPITNPSNPPKPQTQSQAQPLPLPRTQSQQPSSSSTAKNEYGLGGKCTDISVCVSNNGKVVVNKCGGKESTRICCVGGKGAAANSKGYNTKGIVPTGTKVASKADIDKLISAAQRSSKGEKVGVWISLASQAMHTISSIGSGISRAVSGSGSSRVGASASGSANVLNGFLTKASDAYSVLNLDRSSRAHFLQLRTPINKLMLYTIVIGDSTDPYSKCVQELDKYQNWPHFIVSKSEASVNIGQFLPLNLAGRALATQNDAGLIQVGVVAPNSTPFTESEPTVAQAVSALWSALNKGLGGTIPLTVDPRVKFEEQSKSYAMISSTRLSSSNFAQVSGLIGRMHVPGNVGGDPGKIDATKLIPRA